VFFGAISRCGQQGNPKAFYASLVLMLFLFTDSFLYSLINL
jgi:hypothetical protein